MQAIGDTLREARMRQKIDISEIEAKTKIRAKYLRAIENEEFDLLPGTTFAKSFLRTYADALGLDAHRLVEEYRTQYEPRDESELPQFAPQTGAPGGRRERRERRYDRPPPGRGAFVLAAIVLVLALLVVLGITSGSNNGGGKKEATSSKTTTTERRRGARRKQAPPKPAVPKRVTLKVTPTVPTYMCVDKGAGTPVVFQGITATPQTFRGKHLRINLGKTSVALVANGKKVPLTPGPNPTGFDFTPRAQKELPTGQRPCG
jgi:cytoskeleton protein RodZ